jgi:hypothetical protein
LETSERADREQIGRCAGKKVVACEPIRGGKKPPRRDLRSTKAGENLVEANPCDFRADFVFEIPSHTARGVGPTGCPAIECTSGNSAGLVYSRADHELVPPLGHARQI